MFPTWVRFRLGNAWKNGTELIRKETKLETFVGIVARQIRNPDTTKASVKNESDRTNPKGGRQSCVAVG